MKELSLDGWSVDALWALYEGLSGKLATKMIAEQKVLEGRLAALRAASPIGIKAFERRPYPIVPPKFRNPDNPSQTWAGRGKRPRWFLAQISSGRPMDDLRIGGP